MKNERLFLGSRIIIIICGLSLLVVLFVPLWQIQLNAPQYPEGLVLKMYPNKLSGNVDIINGLNHYIGMKTLHSDDFIEFTVLPYIIVFFAVLCFTVAWLNKRKWLVALFSLFVLFGVIAMVDFWRWEYNYGHDLNPDAAIQIPGMAYQPPLIGYKKLLNFGAYSVPDVGGWIFVGVGFLLLTATLIQYKKKKEKLVPIASRKMAASFVFLMVVLMSCASGPQPIKIGVDACSFCKMSIADKRFGAEFTTTKGKVYKFDDLRCALQFKKSGVVNTKDIKETFLVNFEEPHDLLPAATAKLLKSDQLHSPMNGNIANFSNENKLKEALLQYQGEETTWEALVN